MANIRTPVFSLAYVARTSWRVLFRQIVICLVASSLSGCPGGWRERMISTNAPYEVPEGMVATYYGYGVGKAIAPGYLVNGDIYVTIFSGNMQDLTFESPPKGEYRLGGVLSAARNELYLESKSFILIRENQPALSAKKLVSTDDRVTVTPFGSDPLTGCSYKQGEYEVTKERVLLPVYNGIEKWPPRNQDSSVFCFELQFGVQIEEVPPDSRFHLRFNYFESGLEKEGVIYFYPLRYTIFEH